MNFIHCSKSISKVAVAPLGVALTGLLLAAGTDLIAQVTQPPTLRVNISLVTVGVRVVDSKGREVPNLRPGDFRIYEDGVEQQIDFFSSEEQPISIGILLDRSDSMEAADKLDRAKAAAQLLVDTCHRASEYLYIPFDGNWSPFLSTG